MKTSFNLDAYLKRIGYSGETKVSRQLLADLHKHHVKAIPFENLNPFLGMDVKLDSEDLQQKMVFQKRGGYCFEQNLLFHHALKTIGFKTTTLSARVRWNQPEEKPTALSHLFLLIEVDGNEFLSDVGFGGMSLPVPIKLQEGVTQATPLEPYRLMKKGKVYSMQVNINDEWKKLHHFDRRTLKLPDYEAMSWYLSNHPKSKFVNTLITTCVDSYNQARYTLRNNKFTIYNRGNKTEQVLDTPEAIKEKLKMVYDLSVPTHELLDQKLKKLIIGAEQAD
ncbi:MAG: arylamine N-acetyltransferase [Balneolaceae bacterium]|nr:arylamine N-acetyltransferase [Balneolaceae bacterium]